MSDDQENIDLSTLPEQVQAHIKELRGEAAKHRVKAREAETKFAEAGELLTTANARLEQFDALKAKAEKFDALSDDHERLLSTNSKVSEDFVRLKVASSYGIPDEADRLRGATEDEWKTDAAELAKKFKGTGGLPANTALTDPPKTAAKGDQLSNALREALGLAQ